MARSIQSPRQKSSGNTKKTAEKKALSRIDSDLRFFILRPNGHKRRWAIQAYKEPQRKGKRIYFTSETDLFQELALRVKPVNDGYLAGAIDDSTAEAMVEEIITEYRRRQNTLGFVLKVAKLSKANDALLQRFWVSRYAHKPLADPASAQAKFHRALRFIETLSIYTANLLQFKEKLENNTSSVSQYREAVSHLNEIFKFVGRDIRLIKPEEEYKQVSYLTEEEVVQLAESAQNPLYKLKTYVLFGTGCRTAEAYGIDPGTLNARGRAVHIVKQIPIKKRISDSQPKAKNPKRNKKGWVTVIGSMWTHVQEWAKTDKSEINRYSYYDWLTAQARKLWPDEPHKHIHPHDLRHSHAIHLLDRGVPIEGVARNLRNRVEICQKYYTGHEHTPRSLESLKDKI